MNNNRKTMNRMFWMGLTPFLVIFVIASGATVALVGKRNAATEVEVIPKDTVIVEKEVIRYIDTQPKPTYVPKPRIETQRPVVDTPIKTDSL